MRVELLCLDVDGTMTDGSLIYGLNLGNLSLGLHSADLVNFGRLAQTSSLALRPKFTKNHESQTENPSVVDSARGAESSEKHAKIAESSLDSALAQNLGGNNPSLRGSKATEAIHESKIDCHESADTDSRNNEFDGLPRRFCESARNDGVESPQDEFAEILKVFNAKDGLALAYWCKTLKRNAAIITGKKSEILRHRASELGIEFLFMGVKDKGKVLRGLKKDLALDSAQVACVGDDLNDISMFAESSLNFAPRDCASHLKTLPNIEILRCKGGKGAVREAIEIILRKEGIYEDFTNFFAR